MPATSPKSKSPMHKSSKRKVHQSKGKIPQLKATKSSSGPKLKRAHQSQPMAIKPKKSTPFVLMDKVTITPEMFEKATKKEILLYKAASFNE